MTKVAESEIQVQSESTKNCKDLLHNGKGVWNGLSLRKNPTLPTLISDLCHPEQGDRKSLLLKPPMCGTLLLHSQEIQAPC